MSFDDQRLRKRIAWLNNAGGFENQIIYSKVAAAADGLPDAKIMDILKRLEDHYEKVWDPMRWILSSIDKAHWASEGLDEAVEGQLRRRIRWLNTEGGFENGILFAKVAEAAVGVEPRRAMEVLRYLEESWERVEDPTAWACAALRKAAASGGGGGCGGAGAWAPAWDDGWAGADAWGSWADARAVTWEPPAGGGSWPSKGRGKGWQGGDRAERSYPSREAQGAAQGAHDDFYGKLWRRIMWLNTKGGFEDKIEYPKVAELADRAGADRVFALLQHMEDNWGEIKNPTSWICNSLRNTSHAAHDGPDRGGQAGSADWDDLKERRLRTRIRWLNAEGGFENSLQYDRIAEAGWSCDFGRIMEVLKSLEDNWETVGDPTSWVCAQLRKGSAAAPPRRGQGQGLGAWAQGQAWGEAGGEGRGWSQGHKSQAWGHGGGVEDDADFDRKLRTRIRWLNNEGGFENRIIYSKVAEAAFGVPPVRVFSALRYLEDKGKEQVEDPTSWVCAGLAKAKRRDM